MRRWNKRPVSQLTIGLAVGALGTAALGLGFSSLHDLGPNAQAAEAGNGQACSTQQEEMNKAVVASLKPATPAFYALMQPDYVQHNVEYEQFAAINGVSSLDAVKLIDKYGFGRTGSRRSPPLPGQPRNNLAYKVIAKCDMVVDVVQVWHPNPSKPGTFYATYFFNMWRLKGGKLAEHWDPDDMPSPLPDYLKVPVKDLGLGDGSNSPPAS